MASRRAGMTPARAAKRSSASSFSSCSARRPWASWATREASVPVLLSAATLNASSEIAIELIYGKPVERRVEDREGIDRKPRPLRPVEPFKHGCAHHQREVFENDGTLRARLRAEIETGRRAVDQLSAFVAPTVPGMGAASAEDELRWTVDRHPVRKNLSIWSECGSKRERRSHAILSERHQKVDTHERASEPPDGRDGSRRGFPLLDMKVDRTRPRHRCSTSSTEPRTGCEDRGIHDRIAPTIQGVRREVVVGGFAHGYGVNLPAVTSRQNASTIRVPCRASMTREASSTASNATLCVPGLRSMSISHAREDCR